MIDERAIGELAGIWAESGPLPLEGETRLAGGELQRISHAVFPVQSSEQSSFALVAPGEVRVGGPSGRILESGRHSHHALSISSTLIMTLCGVASGPQENFFPSLPLPIEGKLTQGKVSCVRPEDLAAFYRKLLDKHVAAAKKRLARAERARESDRIGLLPHDLWIPA